LSRHKKSTVSRWTGDIDPIFISIAAVSGIAFVALALLVAMHPAPFFFDRPIEVAVQSVGAGPLAWFNSFVSAFAGFVGVGVGVAVIVITFVVRRPATPFVAFSAIYAAVYNVVNIIIRRPRPIGVPHTTSNLMGFSYPSGHVGFFLWLSVLAMVLLAGFAGVLSTALAGRALDDSTFGGSVFAVLSWAFLGGAVYGLVGYWLGGLMVHAFTRGFGGSTSYRQACGQRW